VAALEGLAGFANIKQVLKKSLMSNYIACGGSGVYTYKQPEKHKNNKAEPP
jgi:hypothetical protein